MSQQSHGEVNKFEIYLNSKAALIDSQKVPSYLLAYDIDNAGDKKLANVPKSNSNDKYDQLPFAHHGRETLATARIRKQGVLNLRSDFVKRAASDSPQYYFSYDGTMRQAEPDQQSLAAAAELSFEQNQDLDVVIVTQDSLGHNWTARIKRHKGTSDIVNGFLPTGMLYQGTNSLQLSVWTLAKFIYLHSERTNQAAINAPLYFIGADSKAAPLDEQRLLSAAVDLFRKNPKVDYAIIDRTQFDRISKKNKLSNERENHENTIEKVRRIRHETMKKEARGFRRIPISYLRGEEFSVSIRIAEINDGEHLEALSEEET